MAKKETATANYSATITEASRELTPKERVMFKDLANAQSLNELAKEAKMSGAKLVITVKDYAVVAIHNEASEDVDYNNYLIIDKDGEKYYTGSPSFWSKFMDIYSEMKEVDEDWAIELNLVASKKYTGKEALTCSLV